MASYEILKVGVKSSHLVAIGYDYDRMVLEILFWNGKVYRYYNVPQGTFIGIKRARSHGKYFHNKIRDVFRQLRLYKRTEDVSKYKIKEKK